MGSLWASGGIARGSLTHCRETRVERHAAIDEQGGTGDVVGVVGGQPHRRARNVLGLADATVGDQPKQLRQRLVVVPSLLVDRRTYRTPGAMALTRMPSTATSCASERVSIRTPPFAEA